MRIFTASCREMGWSKRSPVGGSSSQSYHPRWRAASMLPAAQWRVCPWTGAAPAQRAVMVTNSAAVMDASGRKLPSG